ncbi:MAG: 3',5'-cyclic-nucleotide phosphodiesterase [Burkholderiales bacterium]|jgi:ribonuclease BN (tRNA processing enzyme)
MKIDFLGCSGGIEGSTPVGKSLNDYARTTCYRLNGHVLIDAGTGAGRMGMSEMVRIEHILLTHAHLDHIACLPLMIDTIAGLRKTPTCAWGLPGVLNVLRTHILNDAVWPDFTAIPSPEHPFLTLNEYPASGLLEVEGLKVELLSATHGIPACGLLVRDGDHSVAFSGDSGPDPTFWASAAAAPDLTAVVVECSYPNREAELARISKHMHVDEVVRLSAILPRHVSLVIVHRKPGREREIQAQLNAALHDRRMEFPVSGDSIDFPL